MLRHELENIVKFGDNETPSAEKGDKKDDFDFEKLKILLANASSNARRRNEQADKDNQGNSSVPAVQTVNQSKNNKESVKIKMVKKELDQLVRNNVNHDDKENVEKKNKSCSKQCLASKVSVSFW